MSMIGFPLLLIPLAIYNIIVFLMPGVSFVDPVLKLTLMSGAEWPLTLSDMLLTLAILLLLFEVIKGARPGAKYLTDHLLSLILFGGAAAEFVLWPKFGNSTYFLLTMLALVDFLSGVALRARRGARVTSGPAVVSTKGARASSAAATETRFVPEPAPSVPAAAAVAESVLLDRQQPKILRPEIPKPEVRPNAPPPEIVRAPSPEVVTAPSPAVVNAPSPEMVSVPSPEVVHPPSPELANAPSPEVVSAPSPEVVNAPSPEPENAPSPEAANAPSPEIASPDLQPESNSPPPPKESPH
jgi:hypothetical protein